MKIPMEKLIAVIAMALGGLGCIAGEVWLAIGFGQANPVNGLVGGLAVALAMIGAGCFVGLYFLSEDS